MQAHKKQFTRRAILSLSLVMKQVSTYNNNEKKVNYKNCRKNDYMIDAWRIGRVGGAPLLLFFTFGVVLAVVLLVW